METKDPVNQFINSAERVMPLYVYELADYKHERVMSCAPIHAGDYVTVRLSSGNIIQNKQVKRVSHYSSPASDSGHILTAFITLED